MLIGKLKGTPTDRLEDLGDYLELPAYRVDRYLAAEDDLHAFLDVEGNLTVGALEHRGWDQRAVILQVEIPMAAGGC